MIVIALFALLFMLAALYTLMGYNTTRLDAQAEWPTFKRIHHKQTKGLNEDQFIRAYLRVYGPRGPLYGVMTLLAAAIFTPLFMIVVTALYQVFIAQPADIGGGSGVNLADEVRQQFRRDGPLVYSFFLFFGLIASWGTVAFFIAKRFHGNRPGDLEEELRIMRGDAPLQNAPKSRPRPKWSPLVQTKDGLKLPDSASNIAKGTQAKGTEHEE